MTRKHGNQRVNNLSLIHIQMCIRDRNTPMEINKKQIQTKWNESSKKRDKNGETNKKEKGKDYI